MASYTVYGNKEKTKGKEHLNSIEEVNEWLNKVYGKYPTVVVVRDDTGGERIVDDNGEHWVVLKPDAQTFKEYYENEEEFDLEDFTKKHLPNVKAIRSRNEEPDALEKDIETPTFIRKNPKKFQAKDVDTFDNPEDFGDIETPAYIRKDPEYMDLNDLEIPTHIRNSKADVVNKLFGDKSVKAQPRAIEPLKKSQRLTNDKDIDDDPPTFMRSNKKS